jgi:WD40 repeat protein/anti-sigma factor RsiW
MVEQASCPDPARWKALLDGSLPEEEQAVLNGHLQTCARCQQTLESLAAGTEVWSGAARHLGQEPQADEAALQRVVAELEAEGVPPSPRTEPSPSEDLSLEFLDPPEKPGQLGRLGHYEVLEVIGRGGMGVVLKAFDPKLQRVVAIKVMGPWLPGSATTRQRFVREARAAAAVRNEHVIAIYAVEETGDLPYLVMEFIAGVSLQKRLDQRGMLELKEILRIGMQTATGLAAAHSQGLIHRDINPANILVENGVERVKITDFGLARAVDDGSLTQSGVVAGTPQYMAPEQAQGEVLDQRSDLFSLGSVLYALCTGRPPFNARGTLAILKRVSEETPRPIRDINPEIPEWLTEIIRKLHAKKPADRFQGAAEVAELLSQHLAHLQQPRLATMPQPRWAQRRSGWLIAAVVLLVLISGLSLTEATGVTKVAATVIRRLTPDGLLVVEAEDPQVKVTIEGEDGIVLTGSGSQQVRLRAGRYRLLARKDDALIQRDMITLTQGHKQVVKVGRASFQFTPPPPGPLDELDPSKIPAEERFAWQPKELVAVLGEHRQRHWGQVQSVAYSPDGKLIASGGTDGGDTVIRIWDAATMREQTVLIGHSRPVSGLAFLPDSRRLLSGSWDGTLRLWDLTTGKEQKCFGPRIQVNCIAVSRDGRRALSGGHGRIVQLWDVETGQEVHSPFKGHTGSITSVAFSPDSRQALSGSFDDTLRLWDVESGKEVRPPLKGHTGHVTGVVFSPDGRYALSGNSYHHQADGHRHASDYHLRLWDVENGKEVRRFEGHTNLVWGVAFSPDGQRALSWSQDATLRVWDGATATELLCCKGHVGPVQAAAFSPDGGRMVSGGSDGTVRVWDGATGKELRPLTGPTGVASSVCFSPDCVHVLSGNTDELVRLWDVVKGKQLRRFEGHTDPVGSVAFFPDGRHALSASMPGYAFSPQPRNGDRAGPWRLWNVESGKEVRHFLGSSTDWVASVAVSPDGKLAVTACGSQVLRWDVESGGELLPRLEGHSGNVWGVAFSPDGTRVLSGSGDGTVRLWDFKSGKELRPSFKGHTDTVFGVAFSPDDRHGASCSGDQTVRLLDLSVAEPQARNFPKLHAKPVRAVAFAPDGKRLASSGEDGRIILWGIATDDKSQVWKLPGPVNSVAFAADGRHLATANGNGTVYILRIGQP